MGRPGFWEDQERAREVTRELRSLERQLDSFAALSRQFSDLVALWELAVDEGEEALEPELAREIQAVERKLAAKEKEVLLCGPYDSHNAILSLHAGAGGTEAQDWVEMLMRMYLRWAQEHDYTVEVLDCLPGDEAGIKSVTLLVSGENAYGYLKAERGVHRLVRISPFDAARRRHTSFASVDVLPEVTQDEEVEINPDDLRIDTFRSGGAGGQHVNKTDSAVRITHLPTGIVVTCQNERSQHANRLAAMKILQARLLELKRREQEKETMALRGEQGEIAWGNQIRSYIFQPYTLVKDHRTQVEVGNIESVMDGNLDPFISGYLLWASSQETRK